MKLRVRVATTVVVDTEDGELTPEVMRSAAQEILFRCAVELIRQSGDWDIEPRRKRRERPN